MRGSRQARELRVWRRQVKGAGAGRAALLHGRPARLEKRKVALYRSERRHETLGVLVMAAALTAAAFLGATLGFAWHAFGPDDEAVQPVDASEDAPAEG